MVFSIYILFFNKSFTEASFCFAFLHFFFFYIALYFFFHCLFIVSVESFCYWLICGALWSTLETWLDLIWSWGKIAHIVGKESFGGFTLHLHAAETKREEYYQSHCEVFNFLLKAGAWPEQQPGGVDIDQQQTTDERVQSVCCPSLGLVRDAAGCTYL